MPTSAPILDALFRHAPIGLAFWDLDLRYRRINDALAAINGSPAADHLGRTLPEVIGEMGTVEEARLRRVLETGEAALGVDVTGETPAAPGELRRWLASYYPVFGSGGELLGVAAAVLEVTDERASQEVQDRLLRDALTARAHAEAAQVRAEAARAEAEDERRRTAFLAAAGARMASSLDPERTLQDVARAAVPAFADWCGVVLLERGAVRPIAAAHRDPDREEQAWALLSRHPPELSDAHGIGAVIRTGDAELATDVGDAAMQAAARDPEHLAELRGLGLRSSLVVPMRVPERTIGALAFLSAESGRRFQEQDLALAKALAARAALHVSNARLYAERTQIARTLQRSLRPRRLPDVPGLEVAGRYRAAGDENDVGGDFYDVFPTGDGVWTALLGDVSGKGAEAAALTALTRHTLRTAALRDPDPVANLELLNEALLADGDATRFCTVAYVRVTPGEGEAVLQVAAAGHPRPLLLRLDGTVEEVPATGSLLGAFAAVEFEVETVRMGPGELLLLYSDGVTEIRTRDAEYGDRRLRETLAAAAGESAGAVTDAVERTAVQAQDGTPRDDIALLALRVAP